MAQMSWNEWINTQRGAPPRRKALDQSARVKLVERLAADGNPEVAFKLLTDEGYDAAELQTELGRLVDNPYFAVARQLAYRQLKRDWVLDNQRRLEALLPAQVERKTRPSREQFLRDHYATGQPVVIEGAFDHWAALSKWTPHWLREQFGQAMIEVQGERNRNPRYEMQAEKHVHTMRFGEFVDRVLAGPTNDLYMTARNSGLNSEVLAPLWDDVPGIPEYLTSGPGRQGFFWFGPAGTITPLHHDLTNNFMAQVYGRKRVKIVSAPHLPFVYNDLHCFSAVDAEAPDPTQHPAYQQARVLEVDLGPGDLLFLPVGCWHHVRGLDISITMSFTNFVFDNNFSSNYQTYGEF